MVLRPFIPQIRPFKALRAGSSKARHSTTLKRRSSAARIGLDWRLAFASGKLARSVELTWGATAALYHAVHCITPYTLPKRAGSAPPHHGGYSCSPTTCAEISRQLASCSPPRAVCGRGIVFFWDCAHPRYREFSDPFRFDQLSYFAYTYDLIARAMSGAWIVLVNEFLQPRQSNGVGLTVQGALLGLLFGPNRAALVSFELDVLPCGPDSCFSRPSARAHKEHRMRERTIADHDTRPQASKVGRAPESVEFCLSSPANSANCADVAEAVPPRCDNKVTIGTDCDTSNHLAFAE